MVPEKLNHYRQEIQSINPYSQVISFYSDTWRQHFGSNDDLESIFACCSGKITRTDLLNLAKSAAGKENYKDILRLFLATMIWGYGTVGYGAWRTKEMIESPNFETILLDSFRLIKAGQLEKAYRIFKVNRCGQPFFSKFFYFAGLGAGVPEYPLILDNKVYEVLRDKVNVDISLYAKKSSWFLEGYIRYVHDVHEWAKVLQCQAHNIEYFLFTL